MAAAAASSEMTISHGHPQTQTEAQPQALSKAPKLLLSQSDLVLQLPLLNQQRCLHLHKVAVGGQNEYKCELTDTVYYAIRR